MVLEDVFLLAFQHLVFDIGQVVILNIFLQGLADVWVLSLVCELDPIRSPNAVSFALRIGFVTENSSLVECAIKCSNNGTLGVSNHILLLLVDLVTDIALSSLNENDLIDLI